jgi:hypothetical protein
MYVNVTLRYDGLIIIAVEGRKCYTFDNAGVGGLSVATWEVPAPLCRLWVVSLFRVFPHYLINGKILRKKVY